MRAKLLLDKGRKKIQVPSFPKSIYIMSTLLSVGILAGCSFEKNQEISRNFSEKDKDLMDERCKILQVLDEYIQDLNEKNIERLMQKVADEVIFWPFKDKEIFGKEQYRKFHEDLFQNVPFLKITYKVRQEDVGDKLAFFAIDCMATTSKEQKTPEYSRVSLVFRKNEQDWVLIHDHYSQLQGLESF